MWFTFGDPFVHSSTRPRLPQSHGSVTSCEVPGARTRCCRDPRAPRVRGGTAEDKGSEERHPGLATEQGCGGSRPKGRALGPGRDKERAKRLTKGAVSARPQGTEGGDCPGDRMARRQRSARGARRVLCPILIRFFFFLLSCMCSLSVLDISLLPEVLFANIFYWLVASLSC